MIFTYTYLHHSYNKDKGIARYYQVLQKILLMLAQSRECWSRFRVPWRRPSRSCCRDPNATESSGDVFITTDMGISSRHARHVIKLTKRYAVMHLKPCPHESGHFWNRIFFILIRSSGRGFKPLWRAASKQYSFDDRIHWFRVNRRPICVNKYAVSKISGLVWS